MKGSEDAALKLAIKEMIIKECNRDISPESITDNEPIVGSDSNLQLDSLDILQVSIAIQNTYGLRLDDSKEARLVLRSINSLADFIQPES